MGVLGILSQVTIGMAISAIFTGNGMPKNEGLETDRSIQSVKVCDGEGITLHASGEGVTDYVWFRNGRPMQNGDKPSIDIYESGIYEVLTVNDSNCTSEISDGVEVIILPPPSFKILKPATLCEGGFIDLTQSIENFDPKVYDYQVLLPTGEVENAAHLRKVELNGIYQIFATYKDLDCPSEVQSIEINLPTEQTLAYFDHVSAAGGEKGIVLINEPIRFINYSVGDGLTYEWDFGDGAISIDKNPTHTFAEKGLYTVSLTVRSDAGCLSLMEMHLEVNDTYLIMIPNAFTPTGKDNRTFSPKFRGVSSYNMYIYNSWGDLVYHMNKIEDPGWDGTIKGKLVPNGNYVYKAEFITIDGKKVKRSGVFTLIN